MHRVDGGEHLPLPAPLSDYDEKRIDAAFFRRLRELRAATGGWIFYDYDAGRREFVPNAEGTAARPESARHDALRDPWRSAK